MKKVHLSQQLLLQAPNNRHGIIFEPQRAEVSMSDIQDIIHIGVPNSVISPWKSASGGVARNLEVAKLAAIGETIERYCANIKVLPLLSRRDLDHKNWKDAEEWCLFTSEQRHRSDFPFKNIYSDNCMYTNCFSLQDNSEVWIPQPLVVLRDDYRTGIPTSSGLAAGPTPYRALLRAIQELIERDALMMTWMHGIAARSIKIPTKYIDEVEKLGGVVWAFDLTPIYSPFPVIAVAGGIPKRGKWRYSLGVACREDWIEALDKAYLEWNQGVLFAGIYEKYADISLLDEPQKVKSFEDHAIYYTANPSEWYDLPMFKNVDTIQEISNKGKNMTDELALKVIKEKFLTNGIQLYYRDLTTIDAKQLGIYVVRVTSPDLALIFAHQEWPLIDKIKDKLSSRYPWAINDSVFPNLMPHPLG